MVTVQEEGGRLRTLLDPPYHLLLAPIARTTWPGTHAFHSRSLRSPTTPERTGLRLFAPVRRRACDVAMTGRALATSASRQTPTRP